MQFFLKKTFIQTHLIKATNIIIRKYYNTINLINFISGEIVLFKKSENIETCILINFIYKEGPNMSYDPVYIQCLIITHDPI